MSRDAAVAVLEAEITRREDEIVAMREVIAMLEGGGAGAPTTVPPPNQPKSLPAPTGRAKRSATRWGAQVVRQLNGATLHLSGREAAALELLEVGPVSSDGMAEIFSEGQPRHIGVFRLKGKLETAGRTIQWRNGEGYSLVEAKA
jgi:hypothetical protein